MVNVLCCEPIWLVVVPSSVPLLASFYGYLWLPPVALHCTRQKTKGEGITPGGSLEVPKSICDAELERNPMSVKVDDRPVRDSMWLHEYGKDNCNYWTGKNNGLAGAMHCHANFPVRISRMSSSFCVRQCTKPLLFC